MRFVGLAGGAAWLAVTLAAGAPAAAQTQSAAGNTGGTMPIGIGIGEEQVDAATRQKREEIERAYKDTTQKIPAQQAATNDPWAGMRGAEEAKPAARPAAKSAKKKPGQ